MASGNYVNFVIRPNKTVERKIVFDTLSYLAPVYNFASYRYIGFGALWFVDFVLAHKILSVEDMISIEKDEYVASRANFNKPYACVQVKHGDSEIVLPRLQLEEKQLLVWLDYDKSIDGPVFKDLSRARLQFRIISIYWFWCLMVRRFRACAQNERARASVSGGHDIDRKR